MDEVELRGAENLSNLFMKMKFEEEVYESFIIKVTSWMEIQIGSEFTPQRILQRQTQIQQSRFNKSYLNPIG